MLKQYSGKKASIPSDSLWFKRTYRHRDWLTAEYRKTDLALKTGVPLEPEIIPDIMWFETHFIEIVVSGMETLLNENDLPNAVVISDRLQNTFHELAKHFAVDEALQLFRRLRPIIFTLSKKVNINASDSEEKVKQLSIVLGLIDGYCMGLISILLGLSEGIRLTTIESFNDAISKINWDQPETVYATKLPRKVIEKLEYLRKRLEFEYKVEDRIISPLWYRQQIAAFSFTCFLSGVVNDLVGELENIFADEVEDLISENRYIFAAQLVQRGLETCNKFTFHLELVKKYFEQLLALRRVIDKPWSITDWDKIGQRINSIRQGLIIALGKLSFYLAELPHSKYLPDYFGQVCLVLAEECYITMATGNKFLFKNLFPSYFFTCLSAHDRLRTQVHDYDEKTFLGFSTEPIVDLLELSGYAIIYAELDDKGYWDIVKELWNQYLSKHSNPQELLQFIINIIEYRHSQFAISQRDISRTKWEQDFEGRLRDRGLVDDTLFFRRLQGEEIEQHPSPLIRALKPGECMYYKPHDVFLAIYLSERPEADQLKLSRRAKEFTDRLKHEKSTDSKG